jgi:signal transduction histidine kinase
LATKLKGFNRSAGAKVILTLIFLLSIGGTISTINYAYLNNLYNDRAECLIEPDYIQSSQHSNDVLNAFYRVHDVFEYYEEYAEEIYVDGLNATEDFTYSHDEVLSLMEGFDFGFMYQRSNEDELFKNDEYSEENGCFYYFEKESGTIRGANTNKTLSLGSLPIFNTAKIAVSFSDEYIQSNSQEWAQMHDKLVRLAVVAAVCAVMALISFIWLVYAVGVGRDKKLLPVKKINSFFTEFYIALAAAAMFVWVYLENCELFNFRSFDENRIGSFYKTSNIVLAGAATSFFGLIVLYSLLSCVISLKNKTFKNKTITFIIIIKVFTLLKGLLHYGRSFSVFLKGLLTGEAYHKSKPVKIMILRAAALFGVTIFNFLMIFAAVDSEFEWLTVFFLLLEIIAAGLYFYGAWLLLRDYSRLDKQLDDVFNGRYLSDEKIPESSPYFDASEKLISIAGGYQKNLDEKIKSERMKIDLVTNVSHDLKTPLTSIIGYVELLSKEKNLSNEAKEYVEILSMKSERLKNIVSDVFELAKTTSGEISVEFEKLDINKLIVQTVADMEDKISESGLTVKTKLPAEPVFIHSDGKKLYRVLLNLIDNALKYSLEGTRIFIDLTVEKITAVLEIKNISGYEMNFSKEDILERFSRGDKSRSTEGSGLGLSIAQGFTIACGGSFDIKIDGDLFKVIISFNKMQ